MITPNAIRKRFRFFSPRLVPAQGFALALGACDGEPIVLGMRQTLGLPGAGAGTDHAERKQTERPPQGDAIRACPVSTSRTVVERIRT